LSDDNGSFLQEFSKGFTAFNTPVNESPRGVSAINFEMLIKLNELKDSIK
jgi:hypothetical protein